MQSIGVIVGVEAICDPIQRKDSIGNAICIAANVTVGSGNRIVQAQIAAPTGSPTIGWHAVLHRQLTHCLGHER
jgi:hypothetical protein